MSICAQLPPAHVAPSAPPKGLRAQFGHPVGLTGVLIGELMAFKNRRRSAWVHEQLELKHGLRVLEVGYGSGADIVRLVRRGAWVAGVDHSEVMRRMANRRTRSLPRVDLRVGTALALPFEADRFDRVVSINCVQFWPSLAHGLCEALRVLAPGGVAAMAIEPKNANASGEDTSRWETRLTQTMEAVGFASVEARRFEGTATPTVCVLGRKPPLKAPAAHASPS